MLGTKVARPARVGQMVVSKRSELMRVLLKYTGSIHACLSVLRTDKFVCIALNACPVFFHEAKHCPIG